MAGQRITQKNIAIASGRDEVKVGEIVFAKIKMMMHDVTSSGAIKVDREHFGGRIADGLEIVVTPDHYVPNKDIKSATLYKELKTFVEDAQIKKANIHPYMVEGGDYGVCHVMVPEKGHVLPGEVWVGGDSHTCTYGALGAFSTGLGSTEIGNALATGDMWFRVPETYLFDVNGKMPRNTMAKDLFLQVVGEIGVDGAWYQAMEWAGDTIRNMSMDERFTLTNMAIEAGAKSGIIEPDEITRKWLGLRLKEIGEAEFDRYVDEDTKYLEGTFCPAHWKQLWSDKDAEVANRMGIDASRLEPLVACPDLPSNVKPARDLQDVKIDQAYIGGCTGGKWEDFVNAAQVLDGNKIAKGVRLLIVPSTADIQRAMVREGLYDTFMDAGAVFYAPTCGACLGGHAGVLAKGETAISSTNRNFRGRMGHPESFVYLASPQTVAQSALAGHIVGADK